MLAVTTDLPAASAASTALLAGSPAPPISSTNTSMSVARERDRIGEPFQLRQIDAALLAAASARETATTSMRRPQRALKRLALRAIWRDQRRADRAQAGDATLSG